MLFTRCPQCSTVFRITDQALNKAAGQVRCGRCAQIFDAYAQLGENAEAAAATDRTSEHIVLETGTATARAEAVSPDGTGSVRDGAGEAAATGTAERHSAHTAAEAAMSEDEVEAVLGHTADPEEAEKTGPGPLTDTPPWLFEDEPAPRAHGLLWTFAAAAAVVLLAGQLLHHFRAYLAGQPVIGRSLQTVYSKLGAPIVPRWDVDQYTVLDSRAFAQPNSTGHGTLAIRSRIRNDGPREQPYPYVQLRLLDRWESAVGSRIFAPDEYTHAAAVAGLMPVGATIEAELAIVDPGPDAYGFEIDVCVEAESGFRCAADAVFN